MQLLVLGLMLLYNVRMTLEEVLHEKNEIYVQTSLKSPMRIPPNVLSTGIRLEHICSETKTSQVYVVLLMCIYSRYTMKYFPVNLFSLWFCSFLCCGMRAEQVILVLCCLWMRWASILISVSQKRCCICWQVSNVYASLSPFRPGKMMKYD